MIFVDEKVKLCVCVGWLPLFREEIEESARECTVTFSRLQKLVNDQLKIVKKEQHVS